MKAAIVLPTVRHTNALAFLKAWEKEFVGHDIIVVEDNPERTFDITHVQAQHFSWKEIDEDLREMSWIIPRRTDCIRSYGIFKAWQSKVDFIVSLDDDCLPAEPSFIAKHWEMLNTPSVSTAWVSTLKGEIPRGVPYFTTNRTSECFLNHGLWQNVPDFDAVTQLHNTRQPHPITLLDQVIPRGSYFPMCGMNIAFRTELAPVMYFLLMGRDWPYDRFGDIWCGIFAKRICDHLGYGVRSGHPFVDHRRASNIWANLSKETPAYEVNETFWQVVDSAVLTKNNVVDCYRELGTRIACHGAFCAKLGIAMQIWTDFFTSELRNRKKTIGEKAHATEA